MAVRSITLKYNKEGAQVVTKLAPGTFYMSGTQGLLCSGTGTDHVQLTTGTAAAYAYGRQTLYAQHSGKHTLRRIQGSAPYADGSYFIQGDACTSIIAFTDPDSQQDADIVQAVGTGKLAIVDQCPACNDCTTKWNVLRRIQTLQIILAAAKDNQLFQQCQAQRRWDHYTGLRLPASNGCSAAADMNQRDAYVLPARRLFSQYKALVQMWNFLAARGNQKVKLKPAGGHPQGLSLAVQYRTTQCYEKGAKLQMSITAQVSTGQVGKEAAGICMHSGTRLRIYPADTELVHQLDTGKSPSSSKVTIKAERKGQQLDGVIYNTQSDRLTFTYTFTDLTSTGVFGITTTLLPVACAEAIPQDLTTKYNPITQCSLNKYRSLLQKNNQLVLSPNGETNTVPQGNTWNIEVTCIIKNKDNEELHRFSQTKTPLTELCPVSTLTTWPAGTTQTTVYIDDASYYIRSGTSTVDVYPVLGNNKLYKGTDNKYYRDIS